MDAEEQIVRELDRTWNEAYVTNNVAALHQILADDWTGISTFGSLITKAELLANITAAPWPFTTYAFAELVVRLYQSTAIVTGRLTAHGILNDAPVQIDQRYTRVFLKRQEVWQAVITQATAISQVAT